MPAAPLILDEAEVHARLDLPELMDAMQQALVEFSGGLVVQLVRMVLEFGAACR